MTYETENMTIQAIHVKVSRDSQCSRILPMDVAIERAHCDCERNSCKYWIWSKICGKQSQI